MGQVCHGLVRKSGLEHQKKKVPEGRGQERLRDFFDVKCKNTPSHAGQTMENV